MAGGLDGVWEKEQIQGWLQNLGPEQQESRDDTCWDGENFGTASCGVGIESLV